MVPGKVIRELRDICLISYAIEHSMKKRTKNLSVAEIPRIGSVTKFVREK